MNFLDWAVYTVGTGTVLAGLAYLCRELIATRLKASVQHEFDVKVERLRGELKVAEANVQLLAGNVISGMMARQAELTRRRMEGIDTLWASWISLSALKFAVVVSSRLDFEAIRRAMPETEGLAKMLEELDKNNIEQLDWNGGLKARPWVSPLAWAIYSAYTSIIATSIFRIKSSKASIPDVLDDASVLAVVREALPERAAEIDKHGLIYVESYWQDLEAKLHAEFQAMLTRGDDDAAALQHAERILRAVKKLDLPGAITKS